MNDRALLELYAKNEDADAFAELVQRYSGLVYSTCMRITGDPHSAEDVAQECFLALARNATAITSSVPGWLHATATARALNAVRDAATRKRHEEQAMGAKDEAPEPTWEEIAPHVDEALGELPDELRVPLVLHYLQGRTQTDIASELGMDQSTVSRRIEKGTEELREKLRKMGVVASVVVLASLLAQNTAVAAPVTLTAALGKMALAGVGKGGAGASGGAAGAAGGGTAAATVTGVAIGAKVAVAAGALLVAGAAVLGYIALRDNEPKPPARPPAAQVMPQPQEGAQTAMKRPDYSKLVLEGNGHTQDSFSLAIQAAARLLGREADYETVYCLSSNAFSPAIDLGENCTAWWHVQGWQGDECIGTVAGAVGLHAERLDLPPHGLSPEDPEEVFQQKAIEHRKACASILRAKMDAGAVILTTGGWKVRTEEGFAPWCWWGIVTRATDDGDLRGACLGADPGKATGFRDRPLDFLGDCWILSVAKVAIRPDEARTVALRQAIARIRGRGLFRAEKRSVYGLDAMDAWIAQMARVPFCTSCAHAGPQGMAGCAVNNVQTTSAGARAAASYLRKIALDCPESARPHLNEAAKRYDRIVALLAPATWGFYRDMLNDPEKQQAHADNVLKPIKAELAGAADEMEKALEAAKMQRLRFTVSEDLCEPKYVGALRMKVTELLGTSPRVAPGEFYLAYGEYELKEPGIEWIHLSNQGRSAGRKGSLKRGKGTFEITAEPLEVVAGKENILDILFVTPDDTHRLRLRLLVEGVETKARVKREGGKVWIEGVPEIKMSEKQMRLQGMEILLKHRGEQTSLDELLVYSGEAFHLCHGTKWELRTGLNTPVNPWNAAAETYGYACCWTEPSWFFVMTGLKTEDRWKKTNAFLDQIWAEIDAGRPVLLGGCYGECDAWRVVVGYDRENKKVCYMGAEKPYEWTDLTDDKVKELGFWDAQVRGPIDAKTFGYGGWLANAAFLLGEKEADRSEKEKGVMALKRAVKMFRADAFQTGWYGGVTYYFGEKAYEAWASELSELDYPADLKKAGPKPSDAYDMNTIDGQVQTIVTGRTAAVEFCEKAAAQFPKAAQDHLLAAAGHYREEAAIARQAFEPFTKAITEEARAAWLSDKANRKAGAAAIRRMLAEERLAIAEIEKALAAIGK